MKKENWYYVKVVFAQPKNGKKKMYLCETSNILIKAKNANQAYDKAIDWAKIYLQDSIYEQEFVGIAELSALSSTTIKDGTEINGSVFQVKNLWDRISDFIPQKDSLSAFLWESDTEKTLEEIMEQRKGKNFTRAFKKSFK